MERTTIKRTVTNMAAPVPQIPLFKQTFGHNPSRVLTNIFENRYRENVKQMQSVMDVRCRGQQYWKKDGNIEHEIFLTKVRKTVKHIQSVIDVR